MATQVSVPHETDLYIDPNSGVYYGQVYLVLASGGRKRKILSLDTKDLRQARINLRKLTAKLLTEKPKRKLRDLFKDEWPQWLELGKKTGWAPGTFVDIESKGRLHLLPFFGSYNLDDVSEHTWELYIAHKWAQQPDLKLKLHGDYLSMFLNHCFRKGLIDRAPLIRNPDDEEEEGKPYSRKQQAKLLWHSRRKPSDAKKSQTIGLQIRLGLKTGMRKNEILKLKKERIDWEAGVIRLKGKETKGKYSRVIPIFKSFEKALRLQCEASDSAFVFPHLLDAKKPQTTNKTAWVLVKRRAGVKGKFHWTRTTCATEMGESGNPPPAVAAKILGMSLAIFEKKYCKPRIELVDRSIR